MILQKLNLMLSKKESSRRLPLNVAEKINSYSKSAYDKRHRKSTAYKPDDLVLIRDSTIKLGEDRKLKSSYKYKVTKILNKNQFVIQDIPGSSLTSRSYNSILSPNRLKLWIKPPVEPPPESDTQ